jgi:hypothetical protein
MKEINDLWNRVGLIAKLAEEFQNSIAQFGKTVVMKCLFILQEVYKVPLGYNFSLYTYGPYCSDVLSDLDYSEAVEAVSIHSISTGTGGYSVEPSGKTEEYIRKAELFLEQNQRSIKEVIQLFGGMTAKDLELRSTIIYIYKNYLKNKWEISNSEIAGDVKELKPYFTTKQILEAYQELEKMMIFDKIS